MDKDKGDEDMDMVLKREEHTTLEQKLQHIASKSPVVKTVDGKVILERNNKRDIEWYEVDKYKGR
jgi:hypothetical protein